MQLIPGAFTGVLIFAMLAALPLGVSGTFAVDKGAALFFGYLCALALLGRHMPRLDVDVKLEFEYHLGAAVLFLAGVASYLAAAYEGPGSGAYAWRLLLSHVALVLAAVSAYLAGLRGLVRGAYAPAPPTF